MTVTAVQHGIIVIALICVHNCLVICLTNPSEANNSLQQTSIISRLIVTKLGNFSKQLSSSKSDWVRHLSSETHLNLAILIENIIIEQFANCSLMIAYETQYLDSLALRTLLEMSNPKQIIEISNNSIENVQWKTSVCTGYFFLLMDENLILRSMNSLNSMWNYQGRFVFTAPIIDVVTKVALSTVGQHTEHIIGIVLSSNKSQWLIFKKEAFSFQPMKLMNLSKSGVPKDLFKSTISNLNGKELKLVTFEWVPNVFYDRNEAGQVVGYFGLDIQVVRTLSEFLNFTIAFMEPPPNEYFGGLQPNGTWTGLVGVLSRNEADMAVDDLFCTLERNTVADFSASYYVDGMSFGARTALPLPSWQSLTFPFQLYSWIAFLVSIPIIGIVMIMLSKAVNSFGGCNYSDNISALLLPFASLFRQPIRQGFVYTNFSIRTFLMALWLYCFIITIAYSSNLTAYMTVHRLPVPFETIRGIRESGRIVGGVGPFVEAAAHDDGNEDLKVLATRYKIFDTMTELIKEVLKNKAVITVDRLFLEYALVTPIYEGQEDPKTSLRILKESFFTFPISVFLAKHSILKNKFDEVIVRLVDAGLVRKWFDDALALSNKKRLEKNETFKGKDANRIYAQEENVISLNMGHLQGIFILGAFGLLLATIAFACEIFHASWGFH